MTESGLWEKAARVIIRKNIDDKVINPRIENKLVIDTTHIPARAKKGKLIKACRLCKAKEICPYKITTDDNAGVLIKSKSEIYFAHKVGLSSLTVSKLPIDWYIDKGETFDGHFLCPLLQSFVDRFPMFNISKVIADGIFNYKDNYLCAKKYLKAQLVAPINSRKCKEIPNPALRIRIMEHCIKSYSHILGKLHLKHNTIHPVYQSIRDLPLPLLCSSFRNFIDGKCPISFLFPPTDEPMAVFTPKNPFSTRILYSSLPASFIFRLTSVFNCMKLNLKTNSFLPIVNHNTDMPPLVFDYP